MPGENNRYIDKRGSVGQNDPDQLAAYALAYSKELLEGHYLHRRVLGRWYDQFDRDGRSLVDSIPAPSFYHILCAIAEADRVLG
jgi:mannose/cellobiose epimerase-like protein (N-acyl-D-glucosamine 2-epimerase family)